MLAWNIANVWESVTAVLPDHPTVIQGDASWSSARLDGVANALAGALLDAGLERQSKVAVYLYNCPEYIAAYLGAFKASLSPLNINYRYGPNELFYLFDNSDAEAVIFDSSFAPKLEELRSLLPKVKLWLAVGANAPAWSTSVDKLAPKLEFARAPWPRTADDLLLLYTGGTTGAPKGVMWRQEDLLGVGDFLANPMEGLPPLSSPEEAGPRALRVQRTVSCIACPMMHGTGFFSAFRVLLTGGTIVFLDQPRFDAESLWSEVEQRGVTQIAIVGQAFALPMLDALDAHPARWDLSSLRLIGSSGAMWSRENRHGLLRHLPHVTLIDHLSSSEAMGLGTSLSSHHDEPHTAQFMRTTKCAVFDDDGQRVTPGSGRRGRVAITGHIPLGYYKDAAKTAQTFPVIDGVRWAMPGDYAEIRADGTLVLLGRGSQCINTGGEKVFPEEVEEALKRHAAVCDAAVVGLPDPRYGERIYALVVLSDAALVTESALIEHVKSQLAGYKAPRVIFFSDQIPRGANGKLDYRRAKQLTQDKQSAREALATW